MYQCTNELINLPQEHRPVLTPTVSGLNTTLRTPTRMPGEYRLLLTRLGIPQPHRPHSHWQAPCHQG